MAKIETIKRGFKSYYKEVLVPMDWKLNMLEPVVCKIVDRIEDKYSDIIDMLTDEQGEIDIEDLYLLYTGKFEQVGHIELFGIRFTRSDLDRLYEHINRG